MRQLNIIALALVCLLVVPLAGHFAIQRLWERVDADAERKQLDRQEAERREAEKADPAVAAIERLGGLVSRNNQEWGSPVVSVLISVHPQGIQVTDEHLEPLQQFHDVYSVTILGAKLTNGGLGHLRGSRRLTTLELGHHITDNGLAHLEELTSLREVIINSRELTDAGLLHLKGLENLNTLTLLTPAISDAGLEHLEGLSSLRHLTLGETAVTPEGVRKLEQKLLNVSVAVEPDEVGMKVPSRKPAGNLGGAP